MITDRWYALAKLELVEDSPDFWRRRRWVVQDPLLIVSAGKGNRIVIDGNPVPELQDLVWACAPGQWAEVSSSPDEEGKLYLLHYQTGRLANPDEEEAVRTVKAPLFPNGAQAGLKAADLCEKLLLLSQAPADTNYFRAQSIFHELLLRILSDREVTLVLEQAAREIERDYATDITIDRLAATAGMSRYHFMRSFKERFGMSAMQYLTKVRIREAKKIMLRSVPESMQAISAQTGFHNEHYFRATFSKQVGISPAVFIRNSRQKVAAYSWPVIGQLLPLQVVPYAAPIDHYWTRHFDRHYRDDVMVPLSHDYAFNRDALRRHAPDRIIGLDTVLFEPEAEQLREIAPVLLIPWEHTDWRGHLRLVGDFLDKRKEAAKWLERYERNAEGWRTELRRLTAGERMLALKIAGDAIYVWGRRAATVLIDDLGLSLAPSVDASHWYAETSLDRLASFEADRIIVIADRDSRSRATWSAVQASGHWRDLAAVRRGAVHVLAGYDQWVHPWLENTAFNHERFMHQAAKLILCLDS
ncbi:helix-turn-helix domain-containing protein [Cohnella sp. GCM10020058]|uniref:helix-turn-helix domain-containing protein n=1 Tax=Cohnella sp. GCM10020058 TaxID=3317330 RepID=UPI0036414989